MSGWKYKGKYLKEIPEEYFGFIYKIINKLTGCFYIGKKYFELSNRKKLTKKEKLLPENKRKRYKVVKTDSKWLHYWGSSLPLLADINQYGLPCSFWHWVIKGKLGKEIGKTYRYVPALHYGAYRIINIIHVVLY